jgi:formate dehydrogenase maturation protein FdhE
VSYLHCPTCACAYNVAREPTCPRCGIRAGTPADPTDDIISAVEQLARAMARATPIELVAAQAVLDRRDAQLALPAPGKPTGPSPQLLRAVRAALDPTSWPTPAQPMFASFTPERRARWRAAIDAALARLAPRLPAKAGITSRIDRVKTQVKSRVQSFARRLLAA